MCIFSYNSRGFSENKKVLCKSLITEYVSNNQYPLLAIQEHFIMKANCYKFYQAFPESFVVVKPAIKGNYVNGRAKGGLVMIFPQIMSKQIKDISPESWRLQAVLLTVNSKTWLLINSYFPTDKGQGFHEDQELYETLGIMENLINKHAHDKLVLFGDLNCDFKRETSHVGTINRFINALSLQRAWDTYDIDFTYTFQSENRCLYSVLDHFLWSEVTNNSISDAGPLHLVGNMSDHEPIFCVVNIDDVASEEYKEDETDSKETNQIPSWNRASEEEKMRYKESLEGALNSLNIPEEVILCSNIHCKKENHFDQIDELARDIFVSIENTASDTLPKPEEPRGERKKKGIPGWNDEVKCLKDKAFFWYNVWLSAGKPVNCELHSIMKRTRNVFHMMIRKCKRAKEEMSKNKLKYVLFVN